jgi:hypothetical protein
MSCNCSHALSVSSKSLRVLWVLRAQVWVHTTTTWEQSKIIWEQSKHIWEDCVTIWEDSVVTSEQPKLIWEDTVIIWEWAIVFVVISSTFWEDSGVFSTESRNWVTGWAYYVRLQKVLVLLLYAFLPVYRFMFHYATCSQIQFFPTLNRDMLHRENRALPDLGIFCCCNASP